MLAFEDIYHTGFVVPSLEDAMKQVGEAFDVTWTDVVEVDMPVVGPDGPFVAAVRLCYSQGVHPAVELIEPVPDSVWQVAEMPGGLSTAHHLGVWCDDFEATSRHLSEQGHERLATFDDGSGAPSRFAYHRLDSGVIVELVDARRRASLEEWFLRGGRFPGLPPEEE